MALEMFTGKTVNNAITCANFDKVRSVILSSSQQDFHCVYYLISDIQYLNTNGSLVLDMANPWNQAPATDSDFNPVRFVPPSRQQAILAFQVQSISVAGHVKNACPDGFTNHWCLYLQTSQNGAVQIDCQPSYSVPGTVIPGGSKAFFIVSELSYTLPQDVIKYVSLDVHPGLTVTNVVNLLMANGHHKYEFTPQGIGCRKWTTDQVNLLQQQQYAVNVTQCKDARQAILTLWPDGTHHDLDAGAYYQ